MANADLRGTTWRVRWRFGGTREGALQSVSFATPTGGKVEISEKLALTAKSLIESRRHAINSGQVYEAILGDNASKRSDTSLTLKKWIGLWVEERSRSGEIQADTLEKYVEVLTSVAVPTLGALQLNEITEDTLKDWVAWVVANKRKRNGEPLAPATVRRAYAILHQCLGAAVPRWIPRNPAARPAGARKHAVGLPKPIKFTGTFLEPWEVAVIQRHSSPQMQDMNTVLVRTGLRLGELLVLRVKDLMFDGERPHIAVRRALKSDNTIGTPKSEKSNRDVEVTDETIAVLRRRAEGKRPNDLLFSTRNGRPWLESNLRRLMWLPAIAGAQRCDEHPPAPPERTAKTGPVRKLQHHEVSTCQCPGRLKRTPRIHDWRHTNASLRGKAGAGPKEVQLALGHASIMITMDIYWHLWDRPDRSMMGKLDDMLTSKPQ